MSDQKEKRKKRNSCCQFQLCIEIRGEWIEGIDFSKHPNGKLLHPLIINSFSKAFKIKGKNCVSWPLGQL